MLKCLVVDDEPLARECIVNYINVTDFLHLDGTANNPLTLARLLETQEVDLIFLDIQMPVMNGIDFLKVVQNPPMVIIVTAFPTFALEGFQLDVLDYLVKPITFNRFFKAVSKAKDYHQLRVQSAAARPSNKNSVADYFFVKCDYKYERIYLDDIHYIQGLQNYVTIYTSQGKYVTLLSLKDVEANLSSTAFIRVHKSYIVAIAKIEVIENNEIMVRATRIPIGRNYRAEVISRVVTNRLWKKSGDT